MTSQEKLVKDNIFNVVECSMFEDFSCLHEGVLVGYDPTINAENYFVNIEQDDDEGIVTCSFNYIREKKGGD